jgi:catechol 2,3-dioxygenase-like lactoylglutathione lyase family enzyme
MALRKILHTGLAVDSLEDAIKMYEALGFKLMKKFSKPDLDAQGAIVQKGETAFELFQFNDLKHPEINFIRIHIAIYSDSLEKDVDQLTKQGFKVTIPITEGVIYRYAFVQDKSGVNYEIATDIN